MPTWSFLALISTFAVPQLLGVLLYFRLIRFSKWLAFALGFLAPGIVFFILTYSFFSAGLSEAAARGEVGCGMPGLAAAFMLLTGTALQLFVALIVQLVLLKRARLS